MKALLKNEKVMYVVLFLTAVSAFGYLMARNVEAITLMAAVGFLTWYFSKNMTIVLGVALLVTNLVYSIQRFEGFDTSGTPSQKPSPPSSTETCEHGVGEDGKCKPAPEPMANITPARVDGEEDETDQSTFKKVDKVMKDGELEKLTKETETLLKNQETIQNNITQLQPMMKQLNEMISSLKGQQIEADDSKN